MIFSPLPRCVAQEVLRRLEKDGYAARDDAQRMTAERNATREHLKVPWLLNAAPFPSPFFPSSMYYISTRLTLITPLVSLRLLLMRFMTPRSECGRLKLMEETQAEHLIEKFLTYGRSSRLAPNNWMLQPFSQRQLALVSLNFRTRWVKQMQTIWRWSKS